MRSYLIETFLARSATSERARREREVRSAVEELNREGLPVTFDGWTYIPMDEICFLTFTARSSREAAILAERAGLEPFRIVEAIVSEKELS